MTCSGVGRGRYGGRRAKAGIGRDRGYGWEWFRPGNFEGEKGRMRIARRDSIFVIRFFYD